MPELENQQPAAAETPKEPQKPLSLLARERFGNQFYGEVKEPEPVVEPEGEPEVVEPGVELDEAAEVEPEGEGEDFISSFSEFADFLKAEKELEVDPEWLENLTIEGKVNGETRQYPIKDLKAAIQKYEAADEVLSSAKEKAKAEREAVAQQVTELSSQYSVVSGLVQQAEKLLSDEASGIDWAALRTDDPAEYSAKREELRERQAAIDAVKNGAATEYQQWKVHAEQASRGEYEDFLRAQHDALLERVPEWKDQDVAVQEKAELAKFLEDQGFTKEELSTVADHRLILLARMAKMGVSNVTSKDVARKKIAKIPKVMKPGAPKPQEQVNRDKLEELRRKATTSGDLRDAVAYQKAKRGGLL
jgi:hypothetical protein